MGITLSKDQLTGNLTKAADALPDKDKLTADQQAGIKSLGDAEAQLGADRSSGADESTLVKDEGVMHTAFQKLAGSGVPTSDLSALGTAGGQMLQVANMALNQGNADSTKGSLEAGFVAYCMSNNIQKPSADDANAYLSQLNGNLVASGVSQSDADTMTKAESAQDLATFGTNTLNSGHGGTPAVLTTYDPGTDGARSATLPVYNNSPGPQSDFKPANGKNNFSLGKYQFQTTPYGLMVTGGKTPVQMTAPSTTTMPDGTQISVRQGSVLVNANGSATTGAENPDGTLSWGNPDKNVGGAQEFFNGQLNGQQISNVSLT